MSKSLTLTNLQLDSLSINLDQQCLEDFCQNNNIAYTKFTVENNHNWNNIDTLFNKDTQFFYVKTLDSLCPNDYNKQGLLKSSYFKKELHSLFKSEFSLHVAFDEDVLLKTITAIYLNSDDKIIIQFDRGLLTQHLNSLCTHFPMQTNFFYHMTAFILLDDESYNSINVDEFFERPLHYMDIVEVYEFAHQLPLKKFDFLNNEFNEIVDLFDFMESFSKHSFTSVYTDSLLADLLLNHLDKNIANFVAIYNSFALIQGEKLLDIKQLYAFDCSNFENKTRLYNLIQNDYPISFKIVYYQDDIAYIDAGSKIAANIMFGLK